MKCVRLAAWLVLAAPTPAHAQASQPIPVDVARGYFAEARAMCETPRARRLWGVSLCGPIMFVDAPSHRVVASRADANGALRPLDGVFVGVLPQEQNIANTAFDWSGVRWTQMEWPLPDDAQRRHTLIAHELFHRIQPQLALPPLTRSDNAHLDELDGRYYMQLEWRALARALEAQSDSGRRAAALDALAFRAERYRIYPKAAAQEHALEMNEGLAEYTGVVVGNPTPALQNAMALHDLSSHASDPTFVRSFAYATGPAYGLLLDRYAPAWRGTLAGGAGLDSLLRIALGAKGHAPDVAIAQRAARYDAAALHASEASRDSVRQQRVALYRGEFVNGPTLTLNLRHMSVRFDPRSLQPLGDDGTVYPAIDVSDDWGMLDARSGALMRPDWSALVVQAPKNITDTTASGDGWTLELKPGWKLVRGARAGDYVLSESSSSH